MSLWKTGDLPMIRRFVPTLCLSIAAWLISFVRFLYYVDPISGFDNGPGIAVSWIAVFALAAAAVITGCVTIRGIDVTAEMKLSRACGVFFLLGGVAYIISAMLLSTKGMESMAAYIISVVSRLFAVLAAAAAGASGIALMRGLTVIKYAYLNFTVPLFAIARVLHLYVSGLLNSADTVKAMTFASAIVTALASLRVFRFILTREGYASSARASVIALAVCLALGCPSILPMGIRGFGGFAFGNLGDVLISSGCFICISSVFEKERKK